MVSSYDPSQPISLPTVVYVKLNSISDFMHVVFVPGCFITEQWIFSNVHVEL